MLETKNKINNSLVVLFLLFVISVVAAISFVSRGFDVQKPEADIRNKNNANLKSDMAGWKVYYNNDYKFKMDYPDGWKVEETRYEDLSIQSVYFGDPVNGYYPAMIDLVKKPSDISFKDWVESNAYSSSTFERGFVESRGLLSNYYVDKTVIGGMDAYRVLTLSDTYFFPKVFEGKLDDYYHRCKCDYDMESAYVINGGMIFRITSINNMNGEKTSNKLVEKSGRYEVESSDGSYLESKDIFHRMIDSLKFTKNGK